MATKKKTNKSKSSLSRPSKNHSSPVLLLVGLLVVSIIALVGIFVLNFSDAATVSQSTHRISRVQGGNDGPTTRISILGYDTLVRIGKFQSGAIKWNRNGNCYTVSSTDKSFKKSQGTSQEIFYNNEQVVVSKKSSCNL